MKTYLLIWNPRGWKWNDLPDDVIRLHLGKTVVREWSCGNTKRIKIGDRIFLLKLGVPPKGIVASGWIVKPPFYDAHWDAERAKAGNQTLYVGCRWEHILDPEIVSPLSFSKLKHGQLGAIDWSPRAGGREISTQAAKKLETVWASYTGSKTQFVFPDEELSALEGEPQVAFVRHRKREQWLRNAKVAEAKKNGNGQLKCEVPKCGFDFEEVYGQLGRDYAQVHHLKPLADRTKPSQTKLDDLAIVCANCHAMIHRGGKCRALDKLIP